MFKKKNNEKKIFSKKIYKQFGHNLTITNLNTKKILEKETSLFVYWNSVV